MKLNGYVVLEIARVYQGTNGDTRVILAYSEHDQQYVTALLYDNQGPEPREWNNGEYFPQGSEHGAAIGDALNSFHRRRRND